MSAARATSRNPAPPHGPAAPFCSKLPPATFSSRFAITTNIPAPRAPRLTAR